MARYRIRMWDRDRPKVGLKRFRNSDCKLCVIAAAMEMRFQAAATRNMPIDKIDWAVDKVAGHLSDWVTVASSSVNYGELPQRHGHRPPRTRTVRPAVNNGGSVR